LLLINVLLLLLGTVMEPLPIMVLVVPVLMPLVHSLGIDPVHFGVVVTLNLMIGLITPPVGLFMFTMMDIAKVSMERFVRESLPFLAALLLVLLLVTYVPALVLLLPRLAFAP
jgi:TRAP-type C4-dicarboxylate transport system permease large subunit